MVCLEGVKNYFAELRAYNKSNLMIPIILGFLGLAILVRQKIKGY